MAQHDQDSNKLQYCVMPWTQRYAIVDALVVVTQHDVDGHAMFYAQYT